MSSDRPFAVARRILRRALPPDERRALPAELDEELDARFPERGWRARLWYWRQCLALACRFLLERLRERVPRRSRFSARTTARLAPREPTMRGFRNDVSFALGQVARRPAFTAMIVLTLAVGIGPNTAIFSVVNGVLLRPLPYEDPDRLALVRIDISGLEGHPGISQAEIVEFREASRLLEDVGAVTREDTASIGSGDRMEPVRVAGVTPGLFPLLGVQPALGRHFLEEEGLPDREGEPVVILSHALWRQRFAADPAVVGDTMVVDGDAARIVGVMPEGFRLLLGPGANVSPDVELWTVLGLDPEFRNYWGYRTVARLAPGVTIEQARHEIASLGRRLVDRHPRVYEGSSIRFDLRPLHADLVAGVRPAILALLGAVALVLLIACTNAAGLLLARTVARRKELAVRRALGAGRGRILRQILLEGAVLALLAAALGAALGKLGLDVLLRFQPGDLPRTADIGLDGTVLAFTAGVAAFATLAFGILPAWQASRRDPVEALREGGRGAGGIGGRTRGALVVAQVAFSVMLLIGAGLLVRTFRELRAVDLGFEPEGVLTLSAPLDGGRYPEWNERWPAYSALLDRVRALPGVEAVGGASYVPLSGRGFRSSYSSDVTVENEWTEVVADYRWTFPGTFDALGIRMLAGRDFSRAEMEEVRPVAIVDETLAREEWPDGDAVGRRLRVMVEGTALGDDTVVAVIGVVEHARMVDVRRDVRPQVWIPYPIAPTPNMCLFVRTEGDPSALTGSIRRAAGEVGTGRPIHTVRLLTELVDDATADTRFALMLMGLLAVLALLLSAVGIYSVLAYLVRQRTRETGIRMALGARHGDILRLTLGDGLKLALIGVPLGLAGAFFLTRFLEGILYGVPTTDPLTFGTIPVLLLVVALVASWLPARRAARVDPLSALREE